MNRLALRRAARVLQAGGVIAYPTEAVYGLGCLPEDEAAVKRILSMKQRPRDQGLILVGKDFAQLAPYMSSLTPEARTQLATSWPGPVTWVVTASAAVPPWISGGRDTVALRASAHPVVQALCQAAASAIVSTSANRRGHPAARTRWAVLARFRDELDMIVPGSVGDALRPTEIRDARTGRVLRQG